LHSTAFRDQVKKSPGAPAGPPAARSVDFFALKKLDRAINIRRSLNKLILKTGVQALKFSN